MGRLIEVIEPKLLTGAVADELVASIRDCISERERCSIVLSGGSTPGAIYRALSLPPRVDDVEWNKVDIYWGDERWVPHDHTHSNYLMTNETLLSSLSDFKLRIHPVNTDLATPQESALKYAEEIRRVEGLSKGQLPKFDIVLLGIGEDGHTASIFPHSKALSVDDCELCVAVEHPEGGYRISMTAGALFSARKILFIVKGESKAEIVSRVIEGNESFEAIPAKLYQKAPENVTFMLDSGAALKLDKSRYQA